MDISVTTETWTVEDRSWLGSRDGTQYTQSCTLYVPAFTRATHYPQGFIPSGTALAKITSGAGEGLYGPYDAAATDGRAEPEGFLFNSTPVREGGATNLGAPLMWRGVIKVSRLPRAVDSAGREALAAKFRFQ